MADYIDRSEVLKILLSAEREHKKFIGCSHEEDYWPREFCRQRISEDESIRHWIEQIPTADVVPVIRCKDCKYYYDLSKYGLDYGRCRGLRCDLECPRVMPISFCDCADRKDDD